MRFLVALSIVLVAGGGLFASDNSKSIDFETTERIVQAFHQHLSKISDEKFEVFQLKYSKGNHKTFVVWCNPHLGGASCHVQIYNFSPDKRRWSQSVARIFDNTHDLSVGVTQSAIRIWDTNDKLVFDQRRKEKATKGIELYSWKNKSGEWEFTLLHGTNRLKNEHEIKTAEPRFNTAKIPHALSSLAVGEFVSWTHHVDGFAFPTETVQRQLIQAAEKAGVTLDR